MTDTTPATDEAIGRALERHARDGYYDGETELTAWAGDDTTPGGAWRFSVTLAHTVAGRRWWQWSLDHGDGGTDLEAAGEWSSELEADGGNLAHAFLICASSHAPACFADLWNALRDLPLISCGYCGKVGAHRGSALTANGADLERFERFHRRGRR